MNNITYLTDPDFKNGRDYIGASDIPTLALLNLKYGQSPLTLYNIRKGIEKPWEGNERSKVGKEIESLVLKWGLEKIGYDCDYTKFLISRLRGKRKFKHLRSFTEAECPGRPYLKAHTDLLEIDKPFGIEAKSSGYFGAMRRDDTNQGYDDNDLSANGIPSSVYLQVQTQMLCYGVDEWYVAVQIDTGINRLYGPIAADKKTQEKILALAERFQWNIDNNEPPKPESWGDIKKMFPDMKRDSQTVILGGTLLDVLDKKDRIKFLRKKNKLNESEIDDIRNGIGMLLGENQYMFSDNGTQLASRSKYINYYLKDFKKMDKKLQNRLKNDGFISEKEIDKLNF